MHAHTHTPSRTTFQPTEDFALQCDANDSLRSFRERFHIPRRADGTPLIYFAGNSLGLQPKTARALIEQELEDWADLGVEGHFAGTRPWYSYPEMFRESGARLVGARLGEVVMMNSLTVNLHLMMVSFYRPTRQRHRILMESPAFPSDTYAVKSQLLFHGFDSGEALITIGPDQGKQTAATERFEEVLDKEGGRIALVLLGGVNYFTGQVYDMPRIAAAARKQGCVVGLDLAHAAGNVELHLHDWDVDFAVWCNYKYLNSGPGAVAGCFVHEKHADRADLPRLAGWWGNDPAIRFKMHLLPDFVPRSGADGWQVSNPPIFSLAPVRASLEIFDEAGIVALREKSRSLSGYLAFLIDQLSPQRFEVITRDPEARGCQLSMLVHDRPRDLLNELQSAGVVCDFREPNVIRVAPVPLYNSFHDVWRFAQVLSAHDAG